MYQPGRRHYGGLFGSCAGVPQSISAAITPAGPSSWAPVEGKVSFQVMDKPGDAKYGMTEQQLIDSYKELMKKGAKDFGIHAFRPPTPSRMPIIRSWPASCLSWPFG